MVPKVKRNPELTRLYVAAGLAVFIWMIFRVYRLLSAQVETGIDAPSRWALLAVGLANALAIGTLLFIVARSLAKLYFERRSGILGARIRTRLVLALLAVGIIPIVLLFSLGQTFIRKNLDRWFLPGTQQAIEDGKHTADAFRNQTLLRLQGMTAHLRPSELTDLDRQRQALGLDLLALGTDRPRERALAPGLVDPVLGAMPPVPITVATPEGDWQLQAGAPDAQGRRILAGVFMPRQLLEGLARLDRRYQEAFQITQGREFLESLPQSTFLFLTTLILFAAVWTGLAIARTIAEPVRALAKAAQRVGTGDLDVSLPDQGEDELALLSRSFNTMTRDLKHSRQAIEAQAQRIESQRAYLDQLLEALPVGILSWAEDGGLRTFNPVARRWFRVERWETRPEAWRELARQPRMGGLPELQDRVHGTREPLVEELRIGGEGEGRPVRAVVAPLTGGGELAVLEDLSLLAKAEKRAAWQEAARRMAHEVKNPLTPIKLTTQRLLRRSREGRLDPQVVSEGAETILTEVASLIRLVDSFTQFAKLPAPQPRPLDPVDLVRQSLSLYVPTHPKVAWEVDLPGEPLEARWDADMVKRALINMLDNALAALEEAGAPRPRIRVSLRREDARVRLDIEDNGPGVPLENRAHLFEAYFSTKQRGTGLGLAIVRRIAQDHDGDVHYEPLDPGSRFGLSLPLDTRGPAA
jgi:two-component system nitrogen regulation sensor histidine kinase NtrY